MRRLSIFTVICVLGLTNGIYGIGSGNAFPSDLCWRSLSPDTGNQDTDVAVVQLTLTSNGNYETWLSWEENAPRILRWLNGRWSQIPAPIRNDSERMRFPVVAIGPLGDLFLVASANGQDGTTALHIARRSEDSWKWAGNPLISSLVPFTHANDPSIAFGNNGYPIVAWIEERHVKLNGLFVAQWDGSSWQYLGTLKPEGDQYYLKPTIAVGPDNQIWLGWKEGCGNLRIARWDGEAWHNVGFESLRKLAAGSCSATQLSLSVDSKGQAWALWIASKKSGESSLTLLVGKTQADRSAAVDDQ